MNDFRAFACDEALTAIAVTMPPWPGDGQAFEVAGRWRAPPAMGKAKSAAQRCTKG